MADVLTRLLVRDDTTPAHLLDDQQVQIGCVAYDPLVQPNYHYRPNLAAGLIFSIIFGLSTLVLIFQAVKPRKWWYIAFAIGSLGELMGWAARTAAHYCPYNGDLFMMQIAVLIIAPCFYSAGLYYSLAELIRRWGREYSLLSPKLYLWIFISFDLLSIIVQGVGGGLAASGSSGDPSTDKTRQNGTNIMLAGIGLQLAAMCVFSALLAYTMVRARRVWVGRGMRSTLVLAVVVVADALILLRNFYRAVELGQGWTGALMTTEVYQCVLDAAPMALLTLLVNAVHPAFFIGKDAATDYQGHLKRVWESSNEQIPMSGVAYAA